MSNPEADILTVASMSGHSDLQTLKIYMKPSVNKKRLIVNSPEDTQQ